MLELPPIAELQNNPLTRTEWIEYSVYDAQGTWLLHEDLRRRLEGMEWQDGHNMYTFYTRYAKQAAAASTATQQQHCRHPTQARSSTATLSRPSRTLCSHRSLPPLSLCRYWAPFGELLTDLERHGIKVDAARQLPMAERRAMQEKDKLELTFRKWAASYCPEAWFMNPSSGTQVATLLFGGAQVSSSSST